MRIPRTRCGVAAVRVALVRTRGELLRLRRENDLDFEKNMSRQPSVAPQEPAILLALFPFRSASSNKQRRIRICIARSAGGVCQTENQACCRRIEVPSAEKRPTGIVQRRTALSQSLRRRLSARQ